MTEISTERTVEPVSNDAIFVDVLLVEDNIADARLAREAFREVNSFARLQVAADGVEALNFLARKGCSYNAPRPDLVLLDLNMPRVDGREVLANIKKHADLRSIPTIVFTTSEAPIDVSLSYERHANCFLRKPTHWDEFLSVVSAINFFWLTKAKSMKASNHLD